VGTGIHAAIAATLRHAQSGGSIKTADHDAATAAGHAALAGQYEAQDTWALDGLQKLVTKGYNIWCKEIDAQGLLVGKQILGVELVDPYNPVPPGVRVPRTIDCVLGGDGVIEVWDWKTKMRLDEQYIGETMRATLHQWQLLDYAWHVQEWERQGYFGGMVPPRAVVRAGWGLVILAPTAKVRCIPVALTPERLQQWRRQAEIVWAKMASGDEWMNMEACTDRLLHFGQECAFLPACHELNGDENLYGGLYHRKGQGSDDAGTN